MNPDSDGAQGMQNAAKAIKSALTDHIFALSRLDILKPLNILLKPKPH